MPRKPRFWIRATALLAILVLLSACRRDDPEAALRAALDEVRTAIETRDAAALDAALAADFIGPEGLDAAGAERMARVSFRRYRDVGISLGPYELAMTETHATVRFDAVLTGGRGQVLPDAVRVYAVESGWRLEAGDWRLTSLHWTPRL